MTFSDEVQEDLRLLCEDHTHALFYELGLTRHSRVIPGLTVVRVKLRLR